jgi:hypothetical protein
MKFRYWLNAKFINEGVGKIQMIQVHDKESLSYQNVMMHDTTSFFKYKKYDSYKVISTSQ